MVVVGSKPYAFRSIFLVSPLTNQSLPFEYQHIVKKRLSELLSKHEKLDVICHAIKKSKVFRETTQRSFKEEQKKKDRKLNAISKSKKNIQDTRLRESKSEYQVLQYESFK